MRRSFVRAGRSTGCHRQEVQVVGWAFIALTAAASGRGRLRHPNLRGDIRHPLALVPAAESVRQQMLSERIWRSPSLDGIGDRPRAASRASSAASPRLDSGTPPETPRRRRRMLQQARVVPEQAAHPHPAQSHACLAIVRIGETPSNAKSRVGSDSWGRSSPLPRRHCGWRSGCRAGLHPAAPGGRETNLGTGVICRSTNALRVAGDAEHLPRDPRSHPREPERCRQSSASARRRAAFAAPSRSGSSSEGDSQAVAPKPR